MEEQLQEIKTIPPERLTDPHFYLDSAMDLSLKIARHYHPQADDPLTSLTVPEILASAHLAIEDLEEWVDDSVPGSHLLTVKQWRGLAKAPEWFKLARDVSWAISVALNPTNIGRYLTSRMTVNPISKQVQSNLLLAFYVTYLRHVAFYSIEMNSGRLRVGAKRYRELMQQLKQDKRPPRGTADVQTSAAAPDEVTEVTIAVVGQVKAGKSSLINSLLGERQAETDILPLTKNVERYRYEPPDVPIDFMLLDTAGYGEAGADEAQMTGMLVAFQQADVVLLVMDAGNPARHADLKILQGMARWYETKPELKPPPILGVLTHIDLLSPQMEWQPPYDWMNPSGTKEQQIREAVEFNRQEFGKLLAGVVPACTDMDRDRVYGVQEWLLPALTALLDEGHARAVMHALCAELDRDNIGTLLRQLRNAGTQMLASIMGSSGSVRSAEK
jgi:predicted GTPase